VRGRKERRLLEAISVPLKPTPKLNYVKIKNRKIMWGKK
jgi:hypothetical protein